MQPIMGRGEEEEPGKSWDELHSPSEHGIRGSQNAPTLTSTWLTARFHHGAVQEWR